MTSQDAVRVTLDEGTVVGAAERLPNGNFYYSYKGIPYAVPPVGKLRFEVRLKYLYLLITQLA